MFTHAEPGNQEQVVKILMDRDGLSRPVSEDIISNLIADIDSIRSERSPTLGELRDFIYQELALEPEYLDCLLSL